MKGQAESDRDLASNYYYSTGMLIASSIGQFWQSLRQMICRNFPRFEIGACSLWKILWVNPTNHFFESGSQPHHLNFERKRKDLWKYSIDQSLT